MPPPPRESAPARRRRAEDPATPPAELNQLCGDANLHVRRAAARNPTTPAETLRRLQAAGAAVGLAGAGGSPRPLAAIELEAVAGLGPWAQRLVAQHPDAGASLLDRLSREGDAACRAAIAAHPAAAPATLERLLLAADPATRVAAAEHPATDPASVERLVRAGASADLRGFSTPSPSTASTLRSLAEAGPFGRSLAARHPETPADLLDRLAAEPANRAGLAFNPAATAVHLAGLEDAEATDVRRALAAHPATPAAVLERLARSPDARLREAVAARAGHDSAASEAIVLRLALDGSSAVRAALLDGGPLPGGIAQTLARAGSASDLQGLGPPDPTLPAGALRELVDAGGGWALRLAAAHPAAPADLLARLATDADPTLRAAAAAHPNTPASLLTLLVAAGSTPDLQGVERGAPTVDLGGGEMIALAGLGPWARRLAARHPKADADLLDRLAADDDAGVRRAAARHPALPAAAQERLADDPSPDVRWALARNADLPASVLLRFARDPLPALRIRAADDAALPEDTRAGLRADPDADVRAAADRGRNHD